MHLASIASGAFSSFSRRIRSPDADEQQKKRTCPMGSCRRQGAKEQNIFTRHYYLSGRREQLAQIWGAGCFAAVGGAADWRHTLDAAIGGLLQTRKGEKKIHLKTRAALATQNPHIHKRRLLFLKGVCARRRKLFSHRPRVSRNRQRM